MFISFILLTWSLHNCGESHPWGKENKKNWGGGNLFKTLEGTYNDEIWMEIDKYNFKQLTFSFSLLHIVSSAVQLRSSPRLKRVLISAIHTSPSRHCSVSEQDCWFVVLIFQPRINKLNIKYFQSESLYVILYTKQLSLILTLLRIPKLVNISNTLMYKNPL